MAFNSIFRNLLCFHLNYNQESIYFDDLPFETKSKKGSKQSQDTTKILI